MTCAFDQVCVAGACQVACVAPTSYCFGDCLNLSTNHNNCGTCGAACTIVQNCVNGQCVCHSGLDQCSGVCVNLQTDSLNCGVCAKQCLSTQQCQGGQCKP